MKLFVLLTTSNVHQLGVEIVFREMVQHDQHGLLPMVYLDIPMDVQVLELGRLANLTSVTTCNNIFNILIYSRPPNV